MISAMMNDATEKSFKFVWMPRPCDRFGARDGARLDEPRERFFARDRPGLARHRDFLVQVLQ